MEFDFPTLSYPLHPDECTSHLVVYSLMHLGLICFGCGSYLGMTQEDEESFN